MQKRSEWQARQDLSSLLAPRSLAIVGISQPDRFGGIAFHNLKAFGYGGQIYGVNPRYDTLYDRPCYSSLGDLPETPDCVLLAVPDAALVPALEEAARCGVPSGVIFASAYSDEEGPDESLRSQLSAIARESGMTLCGPNCMGFVSPSRRLPVTGYPVNPETQPGGVTLITHSGSVWDAFLQNDRGLGFNYIISSGGEMTTTAADYMQFALSDPSTTAIGLFLETVRDPETFRRALDQAMAMDIPVVVMKTGRSERGAELAQAHSGALAGRDGAYEALFRHYGVHRCDSIDEMMDTLELFAAGLRPRTRRVAALHDSGGQRAHMVDLAEGLGVEFAPIDAETTERLAAVLEPGLDPVNPLDAWGTGNDADVIYKECLQALDADPATGLTVFACDLYPGDDDDFFYPKIVEESMAKLQNPLIWLVHLSAATSRLQADALRGMGVPVLMGTETGLRAVAHLLDHFDFQARLGEQGAAQARAIPPPPGLSALRAELLEAAGPLDEHASKKILGAYGLTLTRESRVQNESEARLAGKEIGYPLVIKTAAGDLHKTDRDGVRLGVRDEEELVSIYRDFGERLGPAALVQELVADGPDLLLGLVNDSQLGPLLSIGSGGIFVEVLDDVRMLALPVSAVEIREALLGLRGAALLRGVRGRPAANIQRVVEAVLGLAALAEDLGDLIDELDINPLRALPDGAVVVDALIVPKQPVSR